MAGRILCFFVMVLGAVAGGCSTSKIAHDAEYVALSQTLQHAPAVPEETVSPIAEELAGPHSVEEYIQVALAQNPQIHAARKRLEAAGYKVPVEASLPDPTVNLSGQPAPVQTAAGEQVVSVSANQKLPWFGKLDRRGYRAEAETDRMRAELAATELEIIEQVQRAYYELYYIQQAIVVTEEEQDLLSEIRDVANSRYRAGRTSQQDVLRADLELSNIQNELIRLRQQQESTQARLARLLHIAPQTPVETLEELPTREIEMDMEALQQQAVAARPELQGRLAALARDQHDVALALLDYKPDVTVGFSWIGVDDEGLSAVANGQDSFILSAGVNLPIYRQRLDSQVRSAEAQAVASTREYDAVRDETLAEVVDLFAKIQSQRDLLMLFEEDILPRSRQTLEVSSRAYNVGEVDFLQLLDNWRQLLRYEISYRRIDASLRQTLAELERIVGGSLLPATETPPDRNEMENADPGLPLPESDPADNPQEQDAPPEPEEAPPGRGDQKPMGGPMSSANLGPRRVNGPVAAKPAGFQKED